MNIPIQVTVDLIQEYQLFTFTAKQKDIGRSAVITVTANGQVIPVTEADGANIYIAKPDGTKVYNACTFDNGRVVAELTNQMLASAGVAKVELELGIASGSRITTPIFNLKVLPTQIDGTAIESSNEFTALQQALLQVGGIATMRADIGDLTKLKTTAKSSLVDAVNEQNSKILIIEATCPANTSETLIYIDDTLFGNYIVLSYSVYLYGQWRTWFDGATNAINIGNGGVYMQNIATSLANAPVKVALLKTT